MEAPRGRCRPEHDRGGRRAADRRAEHGDVSKYIGLRYPIECPMGVQLAHSGTRKLRRHRGLRVARPGLEPATPRFFSRAVRRVRRREIPGNERDNACPSCRAPPSADPTAGASSPGLTRPASDRGNPWAVAVASVPSRSRADRSPDHDWWHALSISARERSRGRRGHFGTVSKPSWAVRSTVGSNPPPLDNRGGIFPRSQAR
jgi:hypothetical protein